MRDIEKHKKARHEWYVNHKNETYERTMENKRKRREWFKEYKKTLSCSKCGFSGKDAPRAISFHHLDATLKSDTVANMVSNCRKKEIILKEIEKCQILCENCHRKLGKEFNKQKLSHNTTTQRWYNEFVVNLKCEICGESDLKCLDFHHINPEEKEDMICNMLNHNSSVDRLCRELNKCRCLCANCHLSL